MSSIKIQKKILVLLITFLLMCFTALYAQPDENGGDPQEDAPLDGGISLLVAAGVGYGMKKVRNNRRSKKKAANADDETGK